MAGDLTARDRPIEYGHFAAWMDRQKYTKKILISGNHDNLFQKAGFESIQDGYADINVDYLCDSGTEFEGLKIWGSPWTKTFKGMNPRCKAFTVDSEEELAEKWTLIPEDTDILITHGPPYSILDGIPKKDGFVFSFGSTSLAIRVQDISPKLHIFGHIHEGYGTETLDDKFFDTMCINCSLVNQHYKPVNKPVRVIL